MLLTEYIKANADWEQLLAEKDIKIKEDGRLTIFNYGIGADFNDSLVRECRGVILDRDLNVVCRGFDKFGNYFESYAAEIDWKNCFVQEKIDGSIVKLYFHDGSWCWATNGMICADDAPLIGSIGAGCKTFGALIRKADNAADIQLDALDPDCTYIFELVSPHNKIVIEYPFTRLYHIGTRNNRTGEELEAGIGIEKPQVYDLHSLDECLEYIQDNMNTGEEVENEGFVVVDSSYNRIKIKSEEYFTLHRARTGRLTAEAAIDILRTEGYEYAVKLFPDSDVELAWYLYQYRLFLRNIRKMETFTESFIKEAEGDRKALAMRIKDDPYACFGFAAASGKKMDPDHIPVKKIMRYIEPFDVS